MKLSYTLSSPPSLPHPLTPPSPTHHPSSPLIPSTPWTDPTSPIKTPPHHTSTPNCSVEQDQSYYFLCGAPARISIRAWVPPPTPLCWWVWWFCRGKCCCRRFLSSPPVLFLLSCGSHRITFSPPHLLTTSLSSTAQHTTHRAPYTHNHTHQTAPSHARCLDSLTCFLSSFGGFQSKRKFVRKAHFETYL